MARRYLRIVGIFLFGLSLWACETGPDTTTPAYLAYTDKNPIIVAGGVGVSDIDASIEFFTETLDMELVDRIPGKIDEVVEEAVLQDYRGTKLYLMDFGPDRNYTNNPCKLVFGVPDTATYHSAIMESGGKNMLNPLPMIVTTFGMTVELDGYIVELIQANTTEKAVFRSIGLGVGNINTASDFYRENFNMSLTGTTTIIVMNDKILSSSSAQGLTLDLYRWTIFRQNYTNIPAKLVFEVRDPAALADTLGNPIPSSDDAVYYVKDSYGYLLELHKHRQ